jgi:hypothetical protein
MQNVSKINDPVEKKKVHSKIPMKNMIAYVFIILGIISTAVGFILLNKTPAAAMTGNSKTGINTPAMPSSLSGSDSTLQQGNQTLKEREVVEKYVSVDGEVKTAAKSHRNSDDTLSKVVRKENAEEKGYSFEKYIVSKFNSSFFKLLEWQGDKFHNGVYAESIQNPDMVFATKGAEKKFAIECKWRSGFINGKVEWANDQQLERYNRYLSENNLPVFIELGIGGEPSQPDEVYAIPLRKMKYSFATKDYLQQFKRLDASRNFYYDQKEVSLR